MGADERKEQFDFEVKLLDSSDVHRMQDMLSMFGRVFDDHASYEAGSSNNSELVELLANPIFLALAAIHENRVIGGLTAYVLPKFEKSLSEVYIYDLAVDESFRRRGVATKLIVHLQTLAAERGLSTIYVQADREDIPAVALYSRLGVCREVFHFDVLPVPPR